MKVSQKFKDEIRKSKEKFYQYELCSKVSLHPSTLSQIIAGMPVSKRTNLKILAIAKLLNLKVSEVFEK